MPPFPPSSCVPPDHCHPVRIDEAQLSRSMQHGSPLKLSSKAPSESRHSSIVHLRVTHSHSCAAIGIARCRRQPSRRTAVVSAQSKQQAQQSHIELHGQDQSAALSVLQEAATTQSVPSDQVTGAIAHLEDSFSSTNGEGALRSDTEYTCYHSRRRECAA